jgi:DNA-binding transcriptional MerR regulator
MECQDMPYQEVDKIYTKIENTFGISKRGIRWYVSEGLIPQPDHQGREAFYDVEKIQLFERLKVIQILQKDYKYSLDVIKDILDKYQNINFERLLILLENLYKEYPPFHESKASGKKVFYLVHNVIHNEFLDKLEAGKIDIDNFKLLDLAKEIKEWSLEDFDCYQQTEETYINRFG